MMTPDLDGVKDFFALKESGLRFVFDLNITSAFLVAHIMKVKKLEVCYYGNSKSRTQ